MAGRCPRTDFREPSSKPIADSWEAAKGGSLNDPLLHRRGYLPLATMLAMHCP